MLKCSKTWMFSGPVQSTIIPSSRPSRTQMGLTLAFNDYTAHKRWTEFDFRFVYRGRDLILHEMRRMELRFQMRVGRQEETTLMNS